jgi:hypothetical protein
MITICGNGLRSLKLGTSRIIHHVAASRDGPEGTPRIYVRDLIGSLSTTGALGCISLGALPPLPPLGPASDRSSNKMPASVRAALVDIAPGGMGTGGGRGACLRGVVGEGETL